MKSITKTPLSEDMIRTLFYNYFDQSLVINDIKELTDGMFNSVYKIIYDTDKNIILKVSVSPDVPVLSYEKDIMRKELFIYDAIKHINIPTPHIIYRNLNRDMIDNDYYFMSVIDGDTLQQKYKKLSNNEIIDIEKQIAKQMAMLHQIEGSYFGYITDDKTLQFKTWGDAISHMFHMILRDAEKQQMHLPYKKIREIIVKYLPILNEVKQPVLVDYDMWAGNIFIKKSGECYEITGIVDFERSFYGDPMAEFSGHSFFIDDIRQKKHMLETYQQYSNHKFSDNDYIRYQIYRLYLMTIMYTETYRYKMPYRFFQKMFSKILMNKCLKKLIKTQIKILQN